MIESSEIGRKTVIWKPAIETRIICRKTFSIIANVAPFIVRYCFVRKPFNDTLVFGDNMKSCVIVAER